MQEKSLDNFHRMNNLKSGYRGTCKPCRKLEAKIYYQKTKDKQIKRRKKHYENNKEKHKQTVYKYRKKHKKRLQAIDRERENERYKNDLNFRLKKVLRSRLRSAIKCNYKSGSSVRDLGCSIDELKVYIESKFQEGMNWDNWATDGWHIDHIKPLSQFDLTDRKQFKQAVHYTNLQPLWAEENLKKQGS